MQALARPGNVAIASASCRSGSVRATSRWSAGKSLPGRAAHGSVPSLQAGARMGVGAHYEVARLGHASSQGPSSVSCRATAVADPGYLPSPSNRLGVFVAKIRAVAFYLWTLAIAVPLFVIMLLIFPFVMATDRYKRNAEHLVNNVWAVASTLPFFPVEIRGKENLPPPGQPVMFVANHQSFMDIYSLFHLWRFFKFISKTSNFLIPIIGWSMYLTGHVGLKRTDKRSQLQVLKDCRTLLQRGCSLLFFPEGTRSRTGQMREFKKGAFSIASKEKVPVVPITINGAGYVMPNKREGEMWAGRVVLTIHPPLLGGTDQELCDAAQAVIASGLPEELRPVPGAAADDGSD